MVVTRLVHVKKEYKVYKFYYIIEKLKTWNNADPRDSQN